MVAIRVGVPALPGVTGWGTPATSRWRRRGRGFAKTRGRASSAPLNAELRRPGRSAHTPKYIPHPAGADRGSGCTFAALSPHPGSDGDGGPPPASCRRGRDWRPVKRPAWQPPPPALRRWSGAHWRPSGSHVPGILSRGAYLKFLKLIGVYRNHLTWPHRRKAGGGRCTARNLVWHSVIAAAGASPAVALLIFHRIAYRLLDKTWKNRRASSAPLNAELRRPGRSAHTPKYIPHPAGADRGSGCTFAAPSPHPGSDGGGGPPPASCRRGRDWRPVKRPAWQPPPPALRRWSGAHWRPSGSHVPGILSRGAYLKFLKLIGVYRNHLTWPHRRKAGGGRCTARNLVWHSVIAAAGASPAVALLIFHRIAYRLLDKTWKNRRTSSAPLNAVLRKSGRPATRGRDGKRMSNKNGSG